MERTKHSQGKTILQRLRSFKGAKGGVAATEFALIMPIMLAMYLGTVEVTQGVLAKRRVNMLARTLADLTSQGSDGTAFTTLQPIFDAAAAVISPLSTTPLKMRITSVTIKTDGTTCVDWSDQRNWTSLAVKSSPTMPTGLADSGATSAQQIIMAEVQYLYTPVMAYVITGPISISDTPSYMRPRGTSKVTMDPSSGVTSASPACS